MEARFIWQSQNFLKREEFVAGLLDKTNITRNDLVIEIGPGKGIITRQLAKRARRVMAVEIDKKLADNLRTIFQNFPNVEIVEADFLTWQLPKKAYKVFSNIPFNMTADIVNKLTEDKYPPEVAYLIMQDKAAFRFTGKPKDSQASILLKPWFDVWILANINRNEFSPVPKINAVLTEFRKRDQPMVKVESSRLFRDFVVYGFNQWQPTILDSFNNVFSPKQKKLIAKELMIQNAKPSDLTLEQWPKLFERFETFVPSERKELVKGAEEKLEKQQQGLKKWHRTR